MIDDHLDSLSALRRKMKPYHVVYTVEWLIGKWCVNCKMVDDMLKNGKAKYQPYIDFHIIQIGLTYNAVQTICDLLEVTNPLPELDGGKVKESLDGVVLPFIHAVQGNDTSQGVQVRASANGVGNEAGGKTALDFQSKTLPQTC